MPPRGAVGVRRGAGQWVALGVLLAGTFMNVFDFFVVNVAVPTLHRDLHASPAALELVVGGYGLTYALGLVTGGRCGDRYGRRRVFRIGMVAFALTSLASGLAPTSATLVAFRLAQGLSAAVMMPQVLAMIRVSFEPGRRRVALGLYGMTIALGQVSGQILGGLLVSADLFGLDWRPIFLVNVPVAAVGLVAGRRNLPETRAPERPGLDLAGVAGLSLAVGLLVVPLLLGRELGWPAWCWGCLAAVGPVGAWFVHLERRPRPGVTPLVDLGLFRARQFSVGLALNVSLYATITAFFFLLSLYLQDGRGDSALVAGLSFVPIASGNLVGSLSSSSLVRRFGERVLTAGACAQGAGLALVLVLLAGRNGGGDGLLFGGLAVFGLGQGLLIPPILGVVLARVRGASSGAASGVLVMTQQLAGTVGLVVVGLVFYGVLGTAVARARYAAAFRASVIVELGLVAFTLLTSLGLHRVRGHAEVAREPVEPTSWPVDPRPLPAALPAAVVNPVLTRRDEAAGDP